MGRLYTYRTASRRVHRSIRSLQMWRRWYGMEVSIDAEGMAWVSEAELMRCYRLALARSYHVRNRRRNIVVDALPAVEAWS